MERAAISALSIFNGAQFEPIPNEIRRKTKIVQPSNLLPELPLDMRFNDGHRMAIAMYLGLLFVSACGNSYVFWSITRLQKKRKLGRINLLLLNLAVADLIVTFVMMPLEIAWNVTVSWRAGDLACRLLSFFRVFGLYVSGFVVMCICLDRYFVIMKPLSIGHAENRNKILLVAAWIISALCSLPQSFIFHVERHPKFQWYEQCVTFNSFPSPDHELAYNLFGFCLMYAIPMMTIIYCYTHILLKMHTMSKRKRNENGTARSSASFIQRAKAKTLKMTIITSFVFCVCWTPYNIICLWYWFDKSSAMNLDYRLQKAFFVFACTNSCLNPLIYGWYHMTRPSRKHVDTIPRRRKSAHRKRNNALCRQQRFPRQPTTRVIENPVSNLKNLGNPHSPMTPKDSKVRLHCPTCYRKVSTSLILECGNDGIVNSRKIKSFVNLTSPSRTSNNDHMANTTNEYIRDVLNRSPFSKKTDGTNLLDVNFGQDYRSRGEFTSI